MSTRSERVAGNLGERLRAIWHLEGTSPASPPMDAGYIGVIGKTDVMCGVRFLGDGIHSRYMQLRWHWLGKRSPGSVRAEGHQGLLS
jgi:hypothetical protein